MDSLKQEIAALTARLIADSGLDYGSAKHRAAQEVWGGAHLPKNSLPSNEEIDLALLEHLELFDPGHAKRVLHMRQAARAMMELLSGELPDAEILLTGAAWKGICAEHAHIHLQVFNDNSKEVEYVLLNANISYESETTAHWRGDGQVEALAMFVPQSMLKNFLEQADHPQEVAGKAVRRPLMGLLISLYSRDESRGALKTKLQLRQEIPARGNLQALLALLKAPPQEGQHAN